MGHTAHTVLLKNISRAASPELIKHSWC